MENEQPEIYFKALRASGIASLESLEQQPRRLTLANAKGVFKTRTFEESRECGGNAAVRLKAILSEK